MKTDDLISLLAANATPVRRHAVERRFLGLLGCAALLVLAVTFLLLGARPGIAAAAALPMFWVKLAFPAALGGAALLCLKRLGYPGMRLGRAPLVIALLLALAWVMSAAALFAAEPQQRQALLFGSSWTVCMVAIPTLSLPALGLAFWAIQGLAPTRPALAGGAAGLFAGACAAFAYSFYCTEMQLPFIGVWYAAGMLVPAAAGATIGKHMLRW